MLLKDEFIQSGNWLFRWRSYLPLAIIALFFLAFREFHYIYNSETFDHIWESVCLCICFGGLGIRIATIGYTPKGTSGRNTRKQIAKSLNTTGMYSLVRNPLYLGNFFIGLGFALFVHLWWMTVIYILVFWLYYERIIFAEEAFLQQQFGVQYTKWANATPVIIPRFKHYRRSVLPFSVRNVLKREYNGFFLIIFVMFLQETAGEIFSQGRLEFDTGWIVLMGVGMTTWLTLRTIKKHTSLLKVEGR